ncbi:YqaE/Pmp3 family membrane protein [Salinibacter ruber]|uniref:YqaE/Pmp3 family membrane protein n=1 Tax=Salinibacter ruber TaxID=146919 RepID=UPI003C6E3B13
MLVLPPAALAWRRRFGLHLTVDLLLTPIGYFPGLIYVFGVFLFTDTETTVVSSEVTVERGGSVYVLTNPALSDVVKIGYTTRSAEERARELTLAAGWTKVGRRSGRCVE